MTEAQRKKLSKIIAQLEAWQHTVRLEPQQEYDTNKAKELLMKVEND